ncbi:GntR family transcriptional regulator [Rhodococcoides yunnanense]|uniref:GntR family transcriptional regulator n=1 Tax=Rhodococcoides yunnanense TaxID=278209 RepID=UPI000934EB18|nr:GntR family transcriptional regulator [Rhodococcus yunnanensis]
MIGPSTVYSRLRENLLAGVYAPDQPLIPITLSEEFGVSRTPVREALALLAQDGLLEPVRRGFLIRRRTDDEIFEIFEAQAAIDSAVASSAAARKTALDIAKLEEAHERAASATTPEDIRSHLRGWHAALRTAAHNETMSTLLTQLDAQIKLGAPWRPAAPDKPFQAPIDEHRRILDAVEDGDGELARTLMLEHHARDRDERIAHLAAGR